MLRNQKQRPPQSGLHNVITFSFKVTHNKLLFTYLMAYEGLSFCDRWAPHLNSLTKPEVWRIKTPHHVNDKTADSKQILSPSLCHGARL